MNYFMMWRLRFILCSFSAWFFRWTGSSYKKRTGCTKGKGFGDGKSECLTKIYIFTFNVISESEADAKVCAERHGRIVHWGNEYGHQHTEGEPWVPPRSAGWEKWKVQHAPEKHTRDEAKVKFQINWILLAVKSKLKHQEVQSFNFIRCA